MKRCLADVNVWLALLVLHHEHHQDALKWYDSLAAGEAGLCRFVQLALIRLLGNRSIMSDRALSARESWDLIGKLAEDERVDFLAEPKDVDLELPVLLKYPIPTRKLVGDAYLAAFAISASLRLVTLDRGYRQFRGLEVDVLGH